MVSLATAEANVAAMRARVAEYEMRYSELQAAANALPQIDAEYKQLTRDYEVIRARYDKLLERREQAQISGEVEASDAGMGFRIIDPPQVPLAPSAPDRPRLMTLVLLAALGCGFGFAFLMTPAEDHFRRRTQAARSERDQRAGLGRHDLERQAKEAACTRRVRPRALLLEPAVGLWRDHGVAHPFNREGLG